MDDITYGFGRDQKNSEKKPQCIHDVRLDTYSVSYCNVSAYSGNKLFIFNPLNCITLCVLFFFFFNVLLSNTANSWQIGSLLKEPAHIRIEEEVKSPGGTFKCI